MIRTLKSLLFAVFALAPIGAIAQQWSSDYLRAEGADELNVCTAGIDYQNAWFTLRFYSDRIDFLFYRADFTLPYGTELGPVVFEIDGSPYALYAQTFPRRSENTLTTAQLMQILPQNDDVVDMVIALQVGTRFVVNFPNGAAYSTSLVGSNAAIQSALICWERNQTGPLENNPFRPSEGGPQGTVPENNPFDSL